MIYPLVISVEKVTSLPATEPRKQGLVLNARRDLLARVPTDLAGPISAQMSRKDAPWSRPLVTRTKATRFPDRKDRTWAKQNRIVQAYTSTIRCFSTLIVHTTRPAEVRQQDSNVTGTDSRLPDAYPILCTRSSVIYIIEVRLHVHGPFSSMLYSPRQRAFA